MKILVTGGAGFIGSHLVDALINKEHDVMIIDNLSTGLKENINPKAKFFQEDLSNFKEVENIFKEEKPEIIYHLAAQINVRTSLSDPVEDARINILNTINLLELSRKHNIKNFIFSSTGGAIYGDTNIPTTENADEKPVSPYGCAKLAVEKYLNFYKEVYGLNYTSLRYSNVYGPRQNPEGEAGVISIFMENLIQNKTPLIFDGTQTRDFVYVGDVVEANLLVLNNKNSAVYNVGTAIETNILDLFDKINMHFGNKIKAKRKPRKQGEQLTSCLSYEKIKQDLGWEPRAILDEGIQKTFLWVTKDK